MNQMEKILISYVCQGDISFAKKTAKTILEKLNTKTDEACREKNLRLLSSATPIELPYNLQGLLYAEDESNFPIDRYLIREEEEELAKKILKSYRVATRLEEMGLRYLPSALLYGDSGCGKTELSKYIAYRAGLPFVYVNFSNLVESLLGKTQSNLTRVLDYVKTNPCVLCFDEIDAIGVERGDHHDVSEMSRVVIALMQGLDRLPNHVIVIGTTNRFDRIDPALARRFTTSYKVRVLSKEEAKTLTEKLLVSAGMDPAEERFRVLLDNQSDLSSASFVVNKCTEAIVERIAAEMDREEEES